MGAGLEDLLCRNKQFFSADDFENHKTWKINGLGLLVCTMRTFEKKLRGEASDHSALAVAHVMQRRQTVDMIRRALLLPDAVDGMREPAPAGCVKLPIRTRSAKGDRP